MTENKYTKEDLKQLQSLSLSVKIGITQTRIREWYTRFNGACFVSYSGGLDSTVLLDLTRRCYPDIEAVYASTLDLPEIKRHIRGTRNVRWLQPKMTFAETVEKYGWCYPSKDISLTVYYARRGSQWAINRLNGVRENGEPSVYRQRRYAKWKFLADSDYKISDKCCHVMKTQPLNEYERKSGKHSIIGTRADESIRRKEAWLKIGCNSFDSKHPISKPLSFWTHQNILEYIKQFNIPYAACYGDIVEDAKTHKLRTTGEQRTVCLCAIGCQLDKENRFMRLKSTHPKLYDYIINSLKLGEFLDFAGVKYD